MAEQKKTQIIISASDISKSGIASSGFVGFEMLKLCSLDIPGIIKANKATVKKSDNSGGSEVTASIKRILRDSLNDDIYAVDNTTTPRIYRTTDGGDTWSYLSAASGGSNLPGCGAAIWKTYLFSFTSTNIDVYGALPTTTLVDNDWTTGALASDTFIHPSCHGQDDLLYIGAGRYVASIKEVAGSTFDPTNSATYVLNEQALDLPSGVRVRTLNELGQWLMVGTWIDASTKHAKIYPWDRVSASFNKPIELEECGIRAAVTIGNLMYFIAGDKGNLYVTNGDEAQLIGQLPKELGSLDGTGTVDVHPHAMIYDKGKLYIAYTGNYLGVWSYDLGTKVFNREYEISTSTSNTLSVISALFPSYSSVGMQMGWFDSDLNKYGIDKVGTDSYSAHKAYIESPFYQVGTKAYPFSFRKMQLHLAKNMPSSGAVKVAYRTLHTGNYTDLKTFNTEGVPSFLEEIGKLLNIEEIQFKISFAGATSPEFMNLILE